MFDLQNYYFRKHITNVPIITLTLTKFFSSMIAISCAVGVTVALAVLLFTQVCLVLSSLAYSLGVLAVQS